MDPRGPHHHQHHQHQHQHHHQHHQQQPPFPGMMLNSPYQQANLAPPPPPQPQPTLISPNSMLQTNRFPFNPSGSTPTKSGLEPLHPGYTGDDVGSDFRPPEFNIDPSQKKKRGRPRKYSPDTGGSNIALGLSPTPPVSSTAVPSGGAAGGSGGGGDSGEAGNSSEHPSSKRNRGRPPGSGKKQLDALGNCGVGFTPHVILVNAGEDIASKIVAFSKDGPRTVCVLSANGSICNVSLRQPANSGGVVTYEGRYEIISLSGSFLFSEDSGHVRTNGLSVSLAGSDGRVLGGVVAGMLLAASQVQIIVGTFIAGGKKLKYMPSIPDSHMLSFSSPTPAAAESPPSQGGSSEGSEENASNHIDRSMGLYSNSNHPMHHHNMQMYTHMGWSNSGSKMPSHQI